MTKYYLLNNRSYTIKQLAAMAGIAPSSMHYRLQQLSPEEAVSKPKSKRNLIDAFVCGPYEYTQKELDAAGVSREVFRQKIYKGYTKEEVLRGR